MTYAETSGMLYYRIGTSPVERSTLTRKSKSSSHGEPLTFIFVYKLNICKTLNLKVYISVQNRRIVDVDTV